MCTGSRIQCDRKSGTTRCLAATGIAILITVIAGMTLGWPAAAAHAELASSDPPADALLATGPERLTIEFTEPVATDAQSPIVRLIDDQGQDQPLSDVAVNPDKETE